MSSPEFKNFLYKISVVVFGVATASIVQYIISSYYYPNSPLNLLAVELILIVYVFLVPCVIWAKSEVISLAPQLPFFVTSLLLLGFTATNEGFNELSDFDVLFWYFLYMFILPSIFLSIFAIAKLIRFLFPKKG